jgi:hypothetical protein
MAQLLGPGLDTSVRVASTANIATPTTAPGATIDGVTMAAGDRFLLKDQTTGAENGIYIWSSATVAARAGDFAATATGAMFAGQRIRVREGTVNRDSEWVVSTPTTTITLATTTPGFSRHYPDPNANSVLDPWAVAGNTVPTLGQTCDRPVASSTWTAPTAATHTLFGGIVIPAGRTVTNVNFYYTTAAATITIYYVSLIRLSDLSVLATSANATGAWAAAPATKTTAVSTPYTPTVDTPVYVGIALASTTAAVIDAAAARAAAGNFARAPILCGTTTTPTTTPISGTAGALTAILQQAYCWLT